MTGFEAVLNRYGKPAAVWTGGEKQVGQAMVLPVLEKDWQRTPTPLGVRRCDRFLFLGAPGLAVDEADTESYVEWDGERYRIMSAQRVTLGEQVLYRWAVLVPGEDGQTA